MSCRLFSTFDSRGVRFRNRIFLSPMCQFSATDGFPNDWHLVHLGSRAVGGAALVMAEATAVAPEGRISTQDLGLWTDDHAAAFRRLTRFIGEQGAVPAVQLAHAGRKAAMGPPWKRGTAALGPADAWDPIGPSPVPFDVGSRTPREMTRSDIDGVVTMFTSATRRALAAGFEVVEIHMAHGYLLHEFLSPITNRRSDGYGGDLDGRSRFPLEVARAVRETWPERLPVFVRVSATDWVDGGWDLEQTVELCRRLKQIGIDLIDCSSGALTPGAPMPGAPGFQTPFATAIRQEVGIPTGAVGLITQPAQADHIVTTGLADVVLMGRELLRDPYWPMHAAKVLGADVAWPVQYLRAKPPAP